MNISSKREYLTILRKRYSTTSSRKAKSSIINEVMNNLHCQRKSAIRALNSKPFTRASVRRGRKETYSYDLIKPLKQLWEVAGYPCSKRLKPQIPELIERLIFFKELHIYEDQKVKLCSISTGTIDKLLSFERLAVKEHGLSGTKRSPLLKTLIPVRTNFDEITQPGAIEMDCVLHCGESLSGIYAETLNMLDIETHWNEKKIFLHKTHAKVVGAVHKLKNQFPFPVTSIDFDNGTEFVNWKLHEYCKRYGITFTRSRSYHKNDQAHIEGKNYQAIRRVIGYKRIESQTLVDLIDDIYQNEHRLLTNFFYTTLKLKKKIHEGGNTKKIYGKAQTPYQRVLASASVDEVTKQRLKKQYQLLNPAQLQRSLHQKLLKLKERIG